MSAAQSTSSTAGGWAPTRRKNAASSDRRTPKSDGPRARHDRAAAAPSTPGPASNRSQQSRTLRRPLTARWAGLADEEQQAIVMSTLSAHFNDAARSRPWQADAALRLLRGTHVLIVAPTNSGKSRPAEMLSLFLRKGQIVVIICPLLSLCQDVVRQKEASGWTATHIDTQTFPERLADIKKGRWEFVVTTPEMFTGKRWQEAFFGSKNVASRLFGLLVIDEAHTVVDEGLARGPQKHCGILKRADLAFRPCYQDIWQVLRWLRCRVLLTSATLAPESQDLLLDVLRMPTSSVSRISVPLHRPGLRLLRVKANGGLAHARDARRSIDGRQAPSVAPHPPTIIYSNTRRATGSVNRQVHEAAHDTIAADSKLCRRVHGNTAKLDRTRAIDDFAAGLLAILSGTSAIGLGMNLCVRLVIQLGLCGIADLMQRFGRAGRDDRPALCAVFCGRMPRQYLARRTTSAFTPEDRAMYDLGITEVCLWLCFLCYAETGRVPLDVAEADKLLPLERRPAALATCLCSICEPDDVGPLLECLPSLTEANSDTILTSSGDALQAHAVAARASADLVDESRRAAGAAAVLGQQGALRGGATRLSGPPGATMTEQAELLGTINRRLAGAVEALYGSNSAVNVDVLWDEADTQAIIDDWAAAGLISEAELQQRYCALAIVPAFVLCIWQELWHATTQVSRRRELDAAARRRHKAAAVQRDAELKRKRDADAAEQRAREAAAHEQYSQASQSASQSTSKRARTLSRKQLSDVLRETDVNTPANRGGADFALDDEEMSETSEEDAMDEWNG